MAQMSTAMADSGGPASRAHPMGHSGPPRVGRGAWANFYLGAEKKE